MKPNIALVIGDPAGVGPELVVKLLADPAATQANLYVIGSRAVLTDAMLASNICVYPHVVPDRYVSLAYLYTAGSILRWFRDQFGAAPLAEAKAKGKDVYEVLIGQAPDGPISTS